MFDLASLYGLYLGKSNTGNDIKLFLLLTNLELYVNGAIIEMKRLERARCAIKKNLHLIAKRDFSSRKKFHLIYLANDNHFYFICIDKVYKLLSVLASELDDADIKKLARRLKKTFDINTIRNHLEHIDERCLGFLNREDKGKGISKNITDFGNFVGDNFSFNGKQFPGGKGGLLELKQIYTDLVEILRDKYASKDPGFVWREQSENIYKQIMQKLKKSGLLQVGNNN